MEVKRGSGVEGRERLKFVFTWANGSLSQEAECGLGRGDGGVETRCAGKADVTREACCRWIRLVGVWVWG